MELGRRVGGRAGALWKDDQRFAIAQHVGGAVEHVEAFIIGDVAGVGDRAARERVGGQAVLDDAVGVLDVADQEHDIEQ
ncbi:hypothetical protein D3C71_2096740 [compost metagenome]